MSDTIKFALNTATSVRFLSHIKNKFDIAENEHDVSCNNKPRFAWIFFAALLTTSLWDAIIYLGGWFIGVRVGIGVLLWISGITFFLALFTLGLLARTIDVSEPNNDIPE